MCIQGGLLDGMDFLLPCLRPYFAYASHDINGIDSGFYSRVVAHNSGHHDTQRR